MVQSGLEPASYRDSSRALHHTHRFVWMCRNISCAVTTQ